MSVLTRAQKVRVEDEDWQLVRMNASHVEILQKVDLVPKLEEQLKKKPGRPKARTS